MVPDGWIQTTIGKLVDRVSKPVSVDPEKAYHQIGIRSHGKGLFYKEPVSGAALGNKRVFWVEPNCFIVNIVFAWEQAVGKTTEQDVGKIASHRFPMYKTRPGRSDLDYLTYLFKTPYGKHLLALASPGGAGRNKTLGQTDFLNIGVCVPPVHEQKRISQMLSTWDQAIATHEKVIRNSQAQMTALTQHLLIPKKRRTSGAAWKLKPLRDLANIYDGTHSTPDYTEKGMPFYSVEHVTSNDFSITKFISKEIFEKENERVKIERGDVLMTRIGDIGTPRYIDWDVEASFYVSLALIKVKAPLNPQFLSFYIRTTQFQKELYKRTIHVAFPKKINLGEIGRCLVAVPSPEEQDHIASILSVAEQELVLLKKQLRCLKEEKRVLMQRLLTGRLRLIAKEAA